MLVIRQPIQAATSSRVMAQAKGHALPSCNAVTKPEARPQISISPDPISAEAAPTFRVTNPSANDGPTAKMGPKPSAETDIAITNEFGVRAPSNANAGTAAAPSPPCPPPRRAAPSRAADPGARPQAPLAAGCTE